MILYLYVHRYEIHFNLNFQLPNTECGISNGAEHCQLYQLALRNRSSNYRPDIYYIIFTLFKY